MHFSHLIKENFKCSVVIIDNFSAFFSYFRKDNLKTFSNHDVEDLLAKSVQNRNYDINSSEKKKERS